MISFFTPKHAFETYNAITSRAAQMRGNVAFDQGIVGALLASQVVRPWPVIQRTVIGVVAGTLLVIVARIYGLPILTPVVNALPVLGSIGEQYLWISVGLLFTITVAFGLHGLLVGGPRLLPLLAVTAVIVSALAYTTLSYGLENVVYVSYLWIAVSILAAGMALIVATKPNRLPRSSRYVSVFCRFANSHFTWITPDYRDTTAFPIRRPLSASCKSKLGSTGLRVMARRVFRLNTAVPLACTRSGR